MSIYDEASLIITPNAYKSGKIYSLKPTDGSGDLSFTRATTKTRINSAGLIESIATGVPSLNYAESCPSWLLEPQRTNLLLNSITLSTQSVSVSAISYTLSFYGSGSIVLTGAYSATLTGGSSRSTLTFTPSAGTLTCTVSGSVTYAQLESGNFATSWIPTAGASVTRNADEAYKTGISSLIGQTEGTLIIDCYIENINQAMSLCSFSDGTLYHRVQITLDNGFIYGYINDVGVIGNIAVTAGRYKIAIAYKSLENIVYVNGSSIGTSNSNVSLGTLSDIGLASVAGVGFGSVHINKVMTNKTRLSNSLLAELTTL